MNAIQRLFMAEEKQALNYLVSLAFAEKNLTARDIEILQSHLDFLDYNHFRAIKGKKAIPQDPFIRFQMIYLLEESLMENGGLSEKEINLMSRLFSYFSIRIDRLRELFQYLKMNIANEHDLNQAYHNLSYLINPAKAS
ncbi:hypothetical protein [Marinoscillum sp. MHG1-6]|uniref:hypothetical protein n=1 Tax=Marinoscillum sp. MHG1-6 TaxID=2959627 RepID=UPI002157ABB4|nr:hypothetical protein [Marinoscillum sp. MHG1-6]